MYMAPEQYKKEEYSYSVDLWALGVTLCELMTGKKPFKSKDKILGNKPTYTRVLSDDATSLLNGLLEKDASKRLGCGRRGIRELKKHPFFEGVNWRERYKKKVKAPYQPEADVAHCDPTEMVKDLLMQPEDAKDDEVITDAQQTKFAHFDFNTNLAEPNIKNEHRRKMLKRAKRKEYSVTLSAAPSKPDTEFRAARTSLAMHGPDEESALEQFSTLTTGSRMSASLTSSTNRLSARSSRDKKISSTLSKVKEEQIPNIIHPDDIKEGENDKDDISSGKEEE